jgi:hypothetical protein
MLQNRPNLVAPSRSASHPNREVMMKRSLVVAIVAAVVVAVLPLASALAGFSGSDIFLPMVGRQAGIFPSNWYTTVWIYNPGSTAVTARVYLLVRNTANISPPWVDVSVAAGDTEKIENAVESLFHQQVYGAMRVTCDTQKLVVTSRVYSKGAEAGEKDSVGQDFAGVPASFAIGAGEKTRVLGAYQTEPSADSDYRFNFGFVETTGHQVNLRVHAIDETGLELGSKDFNVREWSQRQVAFKDHFPAISTENVRLEVEVLSGTGKVIAYGSGIANSSQDPTTFEMEYKDSLLGIQSVQHDATLTGDGTAAAPLGLADGAVTTAKISIAGAAHGQVLKYGSGVAWTDDGLSLPFTGSAVSTGAALEVRNTDTTTTSGGILGRGQYGVTGIGNAGLAGVGGWILGEGTYSGVTPAGVAGVTGGGIGVSGGALTGTGVFGISGTGYGLHGTSTGGDGVFGESSAANKSGVYAVNSNPSGYAGFFSGRVGITSTLECTGCVTKADLAAAGGTSGQVLATDGSTLVWQTAGGGGLALPYSGSGSTSGTVALFGLTNTGSGYGIEASNAGQEHVGRLVAESAGVYGHTMRCGGDFRGVIGLDTCTGSSGELGRPDEGVHGEGYAYGVHGKSDTGDGIFGEASAEDKSGVYAVNKNPDGFAGFFRGHVRVTGYLSDEMLPAGPVCADGAGVLGGCVSDARLKADVADLTSEIDVVETLERLRGVAFNWDTSQDRARNLGDRREIGLIAQEVEAVLPEVVGVGKDGYKTLDYAKLTALLIEVAKAQQSEIAAQRGIIGELRERMGRLEAGR